MAWSNIQQQREDRNDTGYVKRNRAYIRNTCDRTREEVYRIRLDKSRRWLANRKLRYRKDSAMGGRGSSSGIGKNGFSGNIWERKVTKVNRGFGEYEKVTYTETPEGRKLLNRVERLPIGTEITVKSSDRWGNKEESIYRISGTKRDKVLIPKNEGAQENFRYLDGENVTSVSVRDRDAVGNLLTFLHDNGRVTSKLTPRTASEIKAQKTEGKRIRQQRLADRRQLRLF